MSRTKFGNVRELEKLPDYDAGYADALENEYRTPCPPDKSIAYQLAWYDAQDELRVGILDGEQARKTYDWDYGRE